MFPDPGFPPSKDPLPPVLDGPLQFNGVQYRVLQKRLGWHAALQVCESVNGTLAAVRDPRQHAYLTLLLNAVRKPAWIALHNDGVSDIVLYDYKLCHFIEHVKVAANRCCIIRGGATHGWVKRRLLSVTGGTESPIICTDVVT